MIHVTYTHQISALGDSSTTRYGVINIFQRDVRSYVRTSSQVGASAPLEQSSQVGRKCSFGANILLVLSAELIEYYIMYCKFAHMQKYEFGIWDFCCSRQKMHIHVIN